MNPVTWSGPAFLFFYLIFGICILRLLYKFIMKKHTGPLINASEIAKDPYKIAYLSGGKSAAVGVATVSLHDRGLLELENEILKTVREESIPSAQRPIEKALLIYYLVPNKAKLLINYAAVNTACDSYKHELQSQGLLANSACFVERIIPCSIAAMILLAVSYYKISYAHAHGHYNTNFLFILTCIFLIVITFFLFKRLTAAGAQLLSHLQSLFALLKNRASALQAGGETNEAALVAAVFGLGVLSVAQFPLIRQLHPTGNGDASSSSGSSDSGSSCGSSCGGGCGGCGS
ncbi:MAG: TIGR04222 domain-containing membrane protein [Cellvibrio sp.]